MPIEQRLLPVRPLTSGPQGHFFGYYDKSPWNATGRYALALETEADNRMPLPGEKARILLIDTQRGASQPIADTASWNWQQGCMLQWLPPAAEREIIFNDAQNGQHVAVILNIETGMRRVLPRPVYCVSRDGKFALSLSLARLAHTRPVVGYTGVPDPNVNVPTPKDDGVWWLDLTTGESRLILSLDEAAKMEPKPSMEEVKHRFEHAVLNPAGTRFLVVQRWARLIGGRPYNDRLLTVNVDNSDRFILADDDLVEHPTWRDDTRVLAWARQGKAGEHFYQFTDRTREVEALAPDLLPVDGHCSYSPDGRWLLTDTYPDDRFQRHLLLHEVATARTLEIGVFNSPPPFLRGDLRCDLHPRWSRDGKRVCIDSAHEGMRQMYVLDVAEIVG